MYLERRLASSSPSPSSCSRLQSGGARFIYSLAFAITLTVALFAGSQAYAQPSVNEKEDKIRGIVMNRVTRTPIPRALVTSADQRLAVLTDSEGRFEFTLPQAATGDGQETIVAPSTFFFARKPGYLADAPPRTNYADKELTLTLIPEALIVGRVTLPTSEPAEGVFVELYRRQIQSGFARWVLAGGAQSRSDGEFRFAELPAGAYKLVTRESIDRDPLSIGPKAQLYGYPPVYAQNAPDFNSASTIQISAGMTSAVNISVARKPYYPIHIPVANALADGTAHFNVQVGGHQGPGFSLGYNPRAQAVEGTLPDGSYTVEVSGVGTGQTFRTGSVTITVKGAAVRGPTLTPAPIASIRVDVNEQFTTTDSSGSITFNVRSRSVQLKGPRRYLNVTLESADDSDRGVIAGLRNPTGPRDESLVIENARPGRYWVRVSTTRGYPASVRSGGIDLLHEPLVIAPGASVAPIEITMRDDQATIAGTVEGVNMAEVPVRSTQGMSRVGFSEAMLEAQSAPSVYFIPLADSSAQYAEAELFPNGTFTSPPLAPGAYRVLAFDRAQTELEYRDPEAMQAFEGKGPVVQVSGGQKEHVRLQVISSSE